MYAAAKSVLSNQSSAIATPLKLTSRLRSTLTLSEVEGLSFREALADFLFLDFSTHTADIFALDQIICST